MTSTTTPLLIGGLGGMELIIILAVLVLLFGASKLPDLARGTGQALRIFKAETKGLMDDDKKSEATAAPVSETVLTEPISAEPVSTEAVVTPAPGRPDSVRDDTARG